MKVLITGAAGKVGSEVCQYLFQQGFNCFGTDRFYPKDKPPGPFQVIDLKNRDAIYKLLEGCTHILHFGNLPHSGMGYATDLYLENETININLFQAAFEMRMEKIIFASSVQVLGKPEVHDEWEGYENFFHQIELPLDGNTLTNPLNPYALSKVAAEQMLKYFVQKGFPSAIALRFPLIWRDTYSGKYLKFLGGARSASDLFTYLHIKDCASLCEALLQSNLPGYRCYMPAAEDVCHSEEMKPEVLRQKYFPHLKCRKPLGKGFVDNSMITEETGWRPAFTLNRASSDAE